LYEYANMTMFETDGPYGGYECHGKDHKYHDGPEDSIYAQNRMQGKFYLELRKREIYLNQPDDYFYLGGSKTGIYS